MGAKPWRLAYFAPIADVRVSSSALSTRTRVPAEPPAIRWQDQRFDGLARRTLPDL